MRDGAAHRQGVAPVYNAYARVSGDPAFAGRQGDYQALLRPLFMLSFLVDDFLAENEFYGARRVMLSSASSKTALRARASPAHAGNGIKVIGLTSASNVAFVKSLGCYDEVVTYDSVTSLPADSPVAYVDMAGNSALREKAAPAFRRPDEIFRPHRAHPSQHRRRTSRNCPAPSRSGSSRPTRSASAPRNGDRAASSKRFGAAWSGFAPNLDQWIKVIESHGPAAVRQVYLDTLNGRVPPDQGHILSLSE